MPRKPSRTVRVDRSALDAVRIAGVKMSNLCYNLMQDKKNPHARIMREWYLEWDAAERKLRSRIEEVKRG